MGRVTTSEGCSSFIHSEPSIGTSRFLSVPFLLQCTGLACWEDKETNLKNLPLMVILDLTSKPCRTSWAHFPGGSWMPFWASSEWFQWTNIVSIVNNSREAVWFAQPGKMSLSTASHKPFIWKTSDFPHQNVLSFNYIMERGDFYMLHWREFVCLLLNVWSFLFVT